MIYATEYDSEPYVELGPADEFGALRRFCGRVDCAVEARRWPIRLAARTARRAGRADVADWLDVEMINSPDLLS